MSVADDGSLPPWGVRAASVTRRAWSIVLALVAIGFVGRLVAWLLGDDLGRWLRDDVPWLGRPLAVLTVAALAVTLGAGLVWLVASAVSGYRES